MHQDRLTLVLIHGAWHHGSLFAQTARHLRRHDVHTPTVPGHEPGFPPEPDLTLEDQVTGVREYIESRNLTDIVLYGHSLGGVMLTQLAPQIPERIRRLVFHDALIPADGQRVYDAVPPAFEQLFEEIKDPDTNSVMLPFDIWRDTFIQDADENLAQITWDKLVPEPLAGVETRLNQAPFFDLAASGEIPMSYIHYAGDVSLPPGHFPGADFDQPIDGWSYFPRFRNMLPAARTILKSEGSHEVMFTEPRCLAETIIEAARD